MRGIGACLLTALAAAHAAADGLTALRALTLAAPGQGLAHAEALASAGRTELASRLRFALLSAHVAELNGSPWPGPRTLGDVLDGVAQVPDARAMEILGNAWARAFQRHVQLRWQSELPPEFSSWRAQLVRAGPGAWVVREDGQAPVRLFAHVAITNLGPTPLPLPTLQIRLGPHGGELLLRCSSSAGASSDEAIAVGETRTLTCRETGTTAQVAALERATQGRPAAGERLSLLPTHFTSAGGVEALAAAIGSAWPLDRQAWIDRLRPAASGMATINPGTASATAPAGPGAATGADPRMRATLPSTHAEPNAEPSAAPRPPRPSPKAAWRTAFTVAGAAALLLLFGRLIFGRIDGASPSRTVMSTLPLVVAMMGLAAAIGSPWGQAAWEHTTGAGFRQLVLAIDAASRTAPEALRLDTVGSGLYRRFGLFGVAVALGVVFFLAERLALSAGFGFGTVTVVSLLVRLAVVSPLAAAAGGPGGGLVFVGLALGTIALYGLSVATTWLLHRAHSVLDNEGLGWAETVRRGFARALDFAGTSTRGEFWGFVAFAVLGWAVARAFLRPWDLALAALLAVPVAAIHVRRWRALGAAEFWALAAALALGVLELMTR